MATVRWADWGEEYHLGFPDAAAEEAGIEIEWNTILNADWGDKKAVLLAGGELPDAFMGSICFSESDILTNTGSFIALDEYIDEYMPNFKSILESDPTMKALATSADGHIYGLPAKKPCRPIVANQIFINQTWLDNLGLSMPTTYEEFVDVLRAFKEQDANGNGDVLDKVIFMPIVNLHKEGAEKIINDYQSHMKPTAYELVFNDDNEEILRLIRKVRDSGAKLFINSLWPELCGGHDDDRAVELHQPDESWGWILNQGAKLIQTDRPALLLEYLRKKKLHD